MDVKDEITKNTEMFEKKFSIESNADQILNYLKNSGNVVFISKRLIDTWKINLAVFTDTLKQYGISYLPLIEITPSYQKFYGLLVCSKSESLQIATNMYSKIYRERMQNPTLH